MKQDITKADNMKKLLFILLVSFSALNAQTTFSDADIDAARGNRYETLLTNVDIVDSDGAIQGFMQLGLNFIHSDRKYNINNNQYIQYRFEKNIFTNKQETIYMYYRLYKKQIPQYNLPLTTKVEIWGDYANVIKFFIGFWSRQLDFENIKPGTVVNTRFLTDIATLRVDGSTAKITVVTAKDYKNSSNPEPSLSVVPVEKKEKTVKEYIKINDLTDFEKKVIINNLQSQLQNNWLRFSSQSVKEANFTIKVSQTKGDTNAYYQTEGTLPGLQSFLNKLSAGILSHDNELQDTLQVSIHNGQVNVTCQ